uniref:Pyrin domain-containing protein n=1 Tax=Cyprinus carpio carpio TaxID=630221 RepID=A0A9J8DE82_CYPCA
MASDKVLLLNSLKDLREAELKEFQWHLKNDHESISESEMEKADRLKTVDKMVECFGPEEALKITVKILKKMNQNSLAVELENKHKQGQAEDRNEDPAPVIAESKPTEGPWCYLFKHTAEVKTNINLYNLHRESLSPTLIPGPGTTCYNIPISSL